MELHEQFAAWLAGPIGEAFTYRANGDHHTVIRVKKNADFDYLYCQRNYNGSSIERRDKFEYAGIYCKRDGFVYDDQYDIRDLRHKSVMRSGAARMLERLEADVCGAVEAAIGNDRKNLRVKELTAQRDLENLDSFIKYSAASSARQIFLSGEVDGAFSYGCPYDPPRWTEDSLLEYILDPEGYTAREAAAYIDSHQDAILLAFLENSATAREYIALSGNPRHPAHRVKAIMRAMSATAAKTVRVTIRKDGQEFAFKTGAAELRRDCGSNHYWSHNIAAADRQEYERRFGRSDYGPEDIVRIEYARSVIYEAEVDA